MIQPTAIALLPYVVKALNILTSFAILALCVALIFLPTSQSGFWSWHPMKRLLAVIFLPPVILLGIFLWPFALLAWLMRPRCNCHDCQDDD